MINQLPNIASRKYIEIIQLIPGKVRGAGVVGRFAGAFLSRLRGLELAPANWRCLVPATSPIRGCCATGTPSKCAGAGRDPLARYGYGMSTNTRASRRRDDR